MRIFVAGATGVIGRRVVPLLVGRGHSVTGLVRRPSDAEWLRGLGADAVVGDVFDRDGLRRSVGLAAPDVVMHQLTDLKGGNLGANSEMRTTGTRYLMDAALAAGIRRVVAQSIAWAYQQVCRAPCQWRPGLDYRPRMSSMGRPSHGRPRVCDRTSPARTRPTGDRFLRTHRPDSR